MLLLGSAAAVERPLAQAVLPDGPGFRRAILDVTGFEDQTVPAHLPVPAASSGLGPGSYLLIDMPGGSFICSANFVWTAGTKKYLGAAGHCFVPENKKATHGPGADYDPAGTRVEACVANCRFGGQTGAVLRGQMVDLGPVAYARQVENDAEIGNDFGIVEIPAGLASQIRPSMPVFGGPTTTDSFIAGEVVCHYGNGMVVGETFPTKGRVGVGTSSMPDRFFADTAALPGDSGAAIQTCVVRDDGLHGLGATGVITHLTAGSGIAAGTTVSRAIALATQAGLTISLVTGT